MMIIRLKSCLCLVLGVLMLMPCAVSGWTLSKQQRLSCRRQVVSSSSKTALHMNIFDMLSGGRLVPQSSLPYGEPLCESTSLLSARTLAVQERPLSFTGEDFDVYDAETNERIVQVSGAMLHLPGKDKLRIRSNGRTVAELDRKLVAMTPTYDIYREDGSKLGWIEKQAIALTDTFDVYLEGNGGIGPFKPPPAFRIEGDFIDRNFVFKTNKNEAVARVCKDGLFQFDAFNHYQCEIAQGMDAILVIGCLCVIDEEFDEEHQERKQKERGWGLFDF